jgi:biotin carboxyl carrier protein
LTFVVEVAGRRRAVDIRRSGDRWQVTVDGRPVEVDVAMAGDRLSLLIDHRSYEVAVERRSAANVLVHVNGREVPVVLGSSGSAGPPLGKGSAAAGLAAGPAAITAPMPGRVVKLLVKAGDPVAVRQGVLVVEAMKMENELRAPRAGTVRELRVAEGALVEAGATLAVIE